MRIRREACGWRNETNLVLCQSPIFHRPRLLNSYFDKEEEVLRRCSRVLRVSGHTVYHTVVRNKSVEKPPCSQSPGVLDFERETISWQRRDPCSDRAFRSTISCNAASVLGFEIHAPDNSTLPTLRDDCASLKQ